MSDFETTLEKLAFLSFAVEELKESYEIPSDPEARADLLLATEDLAQTTVLLCKEIQDVVWNMPYQPTPTPREN